MEQLSSRAYSVTAEINVPWEKAYEYLETPLNLGKWALGSWETQVTDEKDLFYGTSIFDGELTYFRIKANKEFRLLDFFVGARGALQPRISARIIPGASYGQGDSFCLVTIDAWRDLGMNDDRWHQLCMCHETEITLLKALIEKA